MSSCIFLLIVLILCINNASSQYCEAGTYCEAATAISNCYACPTGHFKSFDSQVPCNPLGQLGISDKALCEAVSFIH